MTEAATMSIEEFDAALGLEGNAPTGGGEGDASLLLGAVLSEDEIKGILADSDSAPEMFVEAARYTFARLKGLAALLDRDRDSVLTVFRNRVALRPDVAPSLLPYALDFGVAHGGHFSSTVRGFFEKADFPTGVVEGAASGEIARGDARRLALFAEMCAERASELRKRSREAEEQVRALVSIVEEIVLGGEQGLNCARLQSLLTTLYPVMSLPLLDRQIELGLAADPEGKNHPLPAYTIPFYNFFELPECYAPERAEKLLRLNNSTIDYHLAKNPALGGHHVWHLYARHSQRDLRAAGKLLALHQEVIDFLVRAQLGVALKGAIPVLTAAKLSRKMISDEAARVAYGACMAGPSDADEAVAAVAYSRLGDEAGEALVRLRVDGIARGVIRQWRANPKDGMTLAAIITYPRKEIRRLLLDSTENLLDKPAASDLYRDVILPAFASDRSPELAGKSRQLQALIAEREGDLTRRLRYVTAEELAGHAEKAETIVPEHFDLIFARAVECGSSGVLKKLADRSDLRLDQYERLAAHSDELAALVARRVPEILPGVKSLLTALRNNHSVAVLVSLAGRPEWDEYERCVFARHPRAEVRTAFARSNSRLGVPELLDLLGDDELGVREALVRNPNWRRYAGALRERAGL